MFTHKFNCLAALLLTINAATAVSRADDCPYKKLQDDAKADTPLGTWEVVEMSPRKDFPFFHEVQALNDVGAGRYDVTVAGVGTLQVADDAIGLRVVGFHDKPEEDKWVPALKFTAKDAGTYSLTGMLDGLWFDGDAAEGNAIQWAVLHMKDGPKVKIIATETAKPGTAVDLSKQEKLASLKLAAGDSVAIMIWRPSYWHAAGGNLKAITINKAAEDTTQPAK